MSVWFHGPVTTSADLLTAVPAVMTAAGLTFLIQSSPFGVQWRVGNVPPGTITNPPISSAARFYMLINGMGGVHLTNTGSTTYSIPAFGPEISGGHWIVTAGTREFAVFVRDGSYWRFSYQGDISSNFINIHAISSSRVININNTSGNIIPAQTPLQCAHGGNCSIGVTDAWATINGSPIVRSTILLYAYPSIPVGTLCRLTNTDSNCQPSTNPILGSPERHAIAVCPLNSGTLLLRVKY